ncbi:ATP-dependent DNA ligase [Actinoplanes sp. TBRC 11911]|nr:ATP-dependent DNA ligase [Actinoplanes sp. TBRC 11911]
MCRGGCAYEVKWDGWRAAAFVGDGEVFLQSRSARPLAAYFPDLVEHLAGLPSGTVLDGELIYFDPVAGRTSFSALQRRVVAGHGLGREVRARPATFVAFDLLHDVDGDLRERPLRERRGRLEALLAGAATALQVCPQTTSYDEALLWLEAYRSLGSEGIVIKDLAGRYRRTGWWKYKLRVTAEAIVGGITEPPVSLLLGRFDDEGRLRYVGRTGMLTAPQRQEVAALAAPVDESPWPRPLPVSWMRFDRGGPVAYQPVRPSLVAEIVVDQAYESGQWRHQVRFLRIRTDLRPPDVAAWTPQG